MQTAQELKELLERTENIKPVGERNGVKIVSFSEQVDAATIDAMNNTGLDTIQFNPDGSVAGMPIKYAAVNLDSYYINRYKRVKDAYWIVTDYRAIKEQAGGSVYLRVLPAFVIKRDKDTNKLYLERVETISDTEFVSDFTHSLNRESMAEILPLLVNGVGVTTDDIEI